MINIDTITNKINAVTGCAVHFGDVDVSPDEYPVLRIMPDGDIPFFVLTQKGSTVTYQWTLQIIVARKNEREAIRMFEELMKNINSLEPETGIVTSDRRALDEVSGTATTEYTANEYIISLPLQIKDILNKEN